MAARVVHHRGGPAGPAAAVLASVRGWPTEAGLLDLQVRSGEAVRLVGRNGSGKTRLLRALAGLPVAPGPRGTVTLGADGRRAEAVPAPDLARRVAMVPDDASGALVGLTPEGEFRLRARRAPTAWRVGKDVAELSLGEARRLGLDLAATSPAPLLLLDEPAEGLDAKARAAVEGLVRSRRQDGAVVFCDATGTLAHLATATVDLGGGHARPTSSKPARAPSGPTVLAFPGAHTGRARLPPVGLGAGLHALVGPNGSGKTTLLRALAGLEPTAPGTRVGGAPARPGSNLVALPENAADAFTAGTVAEELASATAPALRLVPAGLAARHPWMLSRGEAQRVALAKTLGRLDATRRVALLDEPEAHLDASGRAMLTDVLLRLAADGACILAATHDAPLAALATSCVRLPEGT